MANYKTGLSTREKILAVCKKLFYQNGYRETPFGEICKQAEVNPGSLSYHFKSKANIAQIIYTEMMKNSQQQVEKLFTKEDSLQLLLISLCVHFRFMHENVGYRRFSTQFSIDCSDTFLEDGYKHTSPLAYQFLKSALEPEKYDFFLRASVGFDVSINSYISDHLEPEHYHQNIKYAIELYLYFLDKAEFEQRAADALMLAEQLIIDCNNFDISISLDQHIKFD